MSAKPSCPGRSVAYAASGPPAADPVGCPRARPPARPDAGDERPLPRVRRRAPRPRVRRRHRRRARAAGPRATGAPRRGRSAWPGPAAPCCPRPTRRPVRGPGAPRSDTDGSTTRSRTTGDQAGHRRAVVVAGVHHRPGPHGVLGRERHLAVRRDATVHDGDGHARAGQTPRGRREPLRVGDVEQVERRRRPVAQLGYVGRRPRRAVGDVRRVRRRADHRQRRHRDDRRRDAGRPHEQPPLAGSHRARLGESTAPGRKSLTQVSGTTGAEYPAYPSRSAAPPSSRWLEPLRSIRKGRPSVVWSKSARARRHRPGSHAGLAFVRGDVGCGGEVVRLGGEGDLGLGAGLGPEKRAQVAPGRREEPVGPARAGVRTDDGVLVHGRLLERAEAAARRSARLVDPLGDALNRIGPSGPSRYPITDLDEVTDLALRHVDLVAVGERGAVRRSRDAEARPHQVAAGRPEVEPLGGHPHGLAADAEPDRLEEPVLRTPGGRWQQVAVGAGAGPGRRDQPAVPAALHDEAGVGSGRRLRPRRDVGPDAVPRRGAGRPAGLDQLAGVGHGRGRAEDADLGPDRLLLDRVLGHDHRLHRRPQDQPRRGDVDDRVERRLVAGAGDHVGLTLVLGDHQAGVVAVDRRAPGQHPADRRTGHQQDAESHATDDGAAGTRPAPPRGRRGLPRRRP